MPLLTITNVFDHGVSVAASVLFTRLWIGLFLVDVIPVGLRSEKKKSKL